MARKSENVARTEVVPVRFDPILKMAVELTAAVERRPIGSMIEYIVAKAMQDWPITVRDGESISALQIARDCWYRDHPELLKSDKQRIIETATQAK